MSGTRPRYRPLTKFAIAFGTSAIVGYTLRRFYTNGNEIASLNQRDFTPFALVGKDSISSTAAIFRLRHDNTEPIAHAITREAQAKGVWSVQIKQPQLQIARSYTPLPVIPEESDDEKLEMHLLIRREVGGEVSNYLHNLPPESTIDVRGPFVEYTLPSGTEHVLFLAGGTGIAPAIQIATLLKDRPDMRMSVLWANRTREECIGGAHKGAVQEFDFSPRGLWTRVFGHSGDAALKPEVELEESLQMVGPVVKILQDMEKQSLGRLEVDYFVDEEAQYITPRRVKSAISSLLAKTAQDGVDGGQIILVSGPPGFIQHWAGAKVWNANGESQGPLRGVLADMKPKDWQVWKL